MVDDVDVLEHLNVKINEIYKNLVQTISVNNSTGDMQLMADKISWKIHLSARANQLTRKYRVMAARKR